MSRVGKLPIPLPPPVTVKVDDAMVRVEGPKGQLEHRLPAQVRIEIGDQTLRVLRQADTRESREGGWRRGGGLSRAGGEKQVARLGRRVGGRDRVRGTEAPPRLCVFRSNKHIYAQVVSDQTGRTLAAASTLTPALKGQLTK